MKINEIEKLVGISKKNVRFYEEQGLLRPARNRENGYREYTDDDIETLRQIKFLRKLNIPIEEIRTLQSGKATISDVMRRHLVTLERKQQNLNHSIEFCSKLKSQDVILTDLDATVLLEQMEAAERDGASFKNFSFADTKPYKYVGAIFITFIMVALMVFAGIFILWAAKSDPAGAPPLPFLILLLAVPFVVSLGVIYSLIQRIKEIKKGEMDDAKEF